MNSLAGNAALITGASRGIGAAAAEDLARHGIGVLLVARNAEEIEAVADKINQAGGKAVAMVCDVTRYDDLANAVEKCQEVFGRLDILVNNAGVIEPISHLATSDPEQWAHTVDINFKGVYYGIRAALPVMLAQGSGVVVNVSSGAAVSAMEGWSHYCSSKAAALSLTRCAHKEYGDKGIRVVGLSPGTVATDMQVAIKASGINPISQLDPDVHIPTDWAARAITWLCTDDAAEFAGTDFSLGNDAAKRRVGLIS